MNSNELYEQLKAQIEKEVRVEVLQEVIGNLYLVKRDYNRAEDEERKLWCDEQKKDNRESALKMHEYRYTAFMDKGSGVYSAIETVRKMLDEN